MRFPNLRVDLRVALLYAVFGGLWILFSDKLLAAFTSNIATLSRIQTYKGWAFVIVSALLIFSLLRRELNLRKTAEDDFQKSEERYRLISENSADVIWTLNPATLHFTYVSPSVYNLRGLTPEEVIAEPVQSALTPAAYKMISENLPSRIAAFQAGDLSMRTATTEVEQPRKDGSIVPTEVVTTLLTDAHGQVSEILGITRNITERKQAEEKLRDVQNRMREIVESAMDAIISVDTNQQIILVNSAAEQLFGAPAAELTGKPLGALLPERFRTIHHQQVENFGKTGLTSRSMHAPAVIVGLRANGEEFPAEASISQIAVGADKIYTVILRDITERKQAEEKIQRQLQQLNALRMIDIAISSSFDLNVVLNVVLQQVHSQLGVDASAIFLFNTHTQTLEHADSRGFRSNTLQNLQLKLGEGYTSRAVLERKTIHVSNLKDNGGKLADRLQQAKENFTDYYGTPLIAKGEVKGVLGIYQRAFLNPTPEWLDFLETLAGQAAIAIDNAQLFERIQRANSELEQRVMERTAELKQTNAELEHANRAKDEFLATMSHELRTPLNSVLGMSESLLEQKYGPLNDHQLKYLQTIESNGRRLLELINDILDLSKIEAGNFEYQPQLVLVDDLCRSSLTFVNNQAIRKSITLTYENETGISKLSADPRRLKQILINLLTNAIKFTHKNGQVILRVQGNSENNLLELSVIDNGIGIPPNDLKRLFKPFVQLDSGLQRQFQGTGLGLALVQKLTELHGGSVEVESDGVPGKGSRFTIKLPFSPEALEPKNNSPESNHHLEATKPNQENPVAKESVARQTILIADDDEESLLIWSEYLSTHGYEIITAQNGLESLEQAEVNDPAIILLDIQMPVMDGLEVIRLLRRRTKFKEVPILALTALAMPGDRERCLEAGANEYLSKPVGLQILLKTIERYLEIPK